VHPTRMARVGQCHANEDPKLEAVVEARMPQDSKFGAGSRAKPINRVFCLGEQRASSG
jgi:hypothetical protein